jgi:7-carboxy-7-deazaguanine synthase
MLLQRCRSLLEAPHEATWFLSWIGCPVAGCLLPLYGNTMYAVKEIFYTLQGEGARAGRAAVFCRFAGCNLWSGLERDRSSAVCQFCDTDFVGTDGVNGGKFKTAEELAEAVARQWMDGGNRQQATGNQSGVPETQLPKPYVVCTGGEPLLQLDVALIQALHERGFEIAVETNGTIAAPPGIDWICVSPKADADLVQTNGHELKLVLGQNRGAPERFAALAFEHFFLQPMDGPDRAALTRDAVRYCMDHPQWRLSLQTHKMLGIP